MSAEPKPYVKPIFIGKGKGRNIPIQKALWLQLFRDNKILPKDATEIPDDFDWNRIRIKRYTSGKSGSGMFDVKDITKVKDVWLSKKELELKRKYLEADKKKEGGK